MPGNHLLHVIFLSLPPSLPSSLPQHVYKCLYEWCGHGNRDNKVLAFQALDAFFRQISTAITEGGEEQRQRNAGIFKDFIKKFRAIIDGEFTGHRELAVAIKGYGYFAAVSSPPGIK